MAKDVNTMPYNRDAEMALLGCLLIDNEITAELVEKSPCNACNSRRWLRLCLCRP